MQKNNLSANEEKDSSYYFYQQAKNENNTRLKIQNLNKSLSKLQHKKDTLHPLLLDHKIY